MGEAKGIIFKIEHQVERVLNPKEVKKMKRYKLKRDIPTFKAGDIFYLNEGESLIHESDGVVAYSWITLDKFPNILTDWFEEVKEPTRWKPGFNQKYYYLDNDGSVCNDVWDDAFNVDNDRLKIGNCFQTKEEAEKAVEKLKAWKRLKDSGLKFKGWNKSNYDRTFCIDAVIEHDVVAFEFFKDLRTALDMEIEDEAQK